LRVKIEHVANTGRVLQIDTNKNRINTPTRGLIHTEHDKFSSLAKYTGQNQWLNSVTIPNKIHEIVLDYTKESLGGLLQNNEFFKSQLQKLKGLAKGQNGRHTHAFIQIRKQTEALDERDVIGLVELQARCNRLDVITVPDPNPYAPTHGPLRNALKTAKKRLSKYGIDPGLIVPYLDLKTNQNPFAQRIDFLLEENYDMIGIRYREHAVGSSLVIEGIADEQATWFHISGVKSRHSSHRSVPGIHIIPVHSYDSMSSYKGPGFIPRPRNQVFAEPTPRTADPLTMQLAAARQAAAPKMEIFDSVALGFLNPSQYREMFGNNLNCKCQLCRGKTIDDFEGYGYVNGEFNGSKLAAHLTVHEMICSYLEFEQSQDSIERESYLDYLRTKPVINQNYNKIEELTVGTFRRSL
jgi:hypothetical protein